MCGILGVVVLKWSNDVVRNLYDIFDYQASRGVKGGGISTNGHSGLWRFRSYSPYRVFAAYNVAIWDGIRDGDRVLFHHRMPTSTINAPKFNHPIQNEDESLHFIHNGIISNDRELFKHLKGKHTFETLHDGKFNDSEVLVHLYEEEYDKHRDVIKALVGMSERASGSFAVAMQRRGDENIYLVKHNNPIIISKDKQGNLYFSSELDSTNGNLERIDEMGDSSIAVLSRKGFVKHGTFKAPIMKYLYASEKKRFDLYDAPEYISSLGEWGF